ncbi:MAG: hypothetical protein JO130_18605 [Solirubrobacterales bacterium]|nr:hypothetical protein [Solirubrobacterales bacterium]
MQAYSSTLELDRAVMKQNDTFPPMVVLLEDSNGPIDLTGAQSVTLVLKGNQTSTLVTGPCTTENMHAGAAQYAWGASDTDTPDTYQVEVEILWGTGSRQTVPNAYASNPVLAIVQQLNPGADQ